MAAVSEVLSRPYFHNQNQLLFICQKQISQFTFSIGIFKDVKVPKEMPLTFLRKSYAVGPRQCVWPFGAGSEDLL